MLRIWLFGSLSVAHDGNGEPVTPVSGRCGSLLAYLALGRGRYFSRSELLDILWPDRDAAASSTGSFNTALWRLRRLIECKPPHGGDFIASDRRGGIGLNGAADIWLDTEEFERHIAPGLGKAIEQLDDGDIAGLQIGVGLYKSDILVDFTDEWALREREKHRRLYLNSLWQLMKIASIRGLYGEGIRHAQGILDFDALREDVHRELIRLFVLNGQRAQALKQFEACRELLWRELSIAPMRETMELYRHIADNAVTGRDTSPSAEPASAEIGLGTDEASNLPSTPAGHVRSQLVIARQYLALADAQLALSLRHPGV